MLLVGGQQRQLVGDVVVIGVGLADVAAQVAVCLEDIIGGIALHAGAVGAADDLAQPAGVEPVLQRRAHIYRLPLRQPDSCGVLVKGVIQPVLPVVSALVDDGIAAALEQLVGGAVQFHDVVFRNGSEARQQQLIAALHDAAAVLRGLNSGHGHGVAEQGAGDTAAPVDLGGGVQALFLRGALLQPDLLVVVL